MSDAKIKIKKPVRKQAHFQCEKDLYQEFEEYCYNNGKSVAEALRAYMKKFYEMQKNKESEE